MSCRCRTINLAVESIENLKQMEGRLQKFPGKLKEPKECRKYEPMPAPPGQVSRKKIMVCTTRPVQFQCPPVPCVCPPCPICPTYTERIINLLKTGFKLFVFYCMVKWTVNENIWNGHTGTTKFTLEFLEKNFPSKKGTVSLPSMQALKYRILNTWDKSFGNFFYYTFALPLHTFSQVTDETVEEDKKPCKECPS